MNQHNDNKLAARTLLIGATTMITAAAFTGCAPGHGKHTSKFIEEREQAKATIKAATSFDMAQQSYLAGDLDKALDKIDDSIAMNDQVAKSHVLKGRILLELTEFDRALSSLDAAIDLSTDEDTGEQTNHEAHYFKGIIYERIANSERALESFRQAAKIEAGDPQYAVAVAETLIDLDRIEEARAFLEQDDTHEHNAGVNQTLGHIALMQGKKELAVEKFEQARLLSPDNTDIMEDLAGAQMKVGRFAEAEYTISRLLEQDEAENRRDLLHLKAQCLLEVDRPVDARTVLLQLTESDAGQADVEAWIALGNVAYKLSDMARLRTASARVVALTPNRFEGYLLRGLWERAQGHPSRALKSLNRAVQLRGDDVTPLIVTGIVQREMGDVRGAREVFEMARRQDPSNETVQQFIELLNTRGGAVATHPDDQ